MVIDDSRSRFYRLIFYLAAAHNFAFAAWIVIWPRSLFDLFAMEALTYPVLWQSLGIAVGAFGIGYAYAARRLDRAFPIIAFGLFCKVLAAIVWVAWVRTGVWPIRTFALTLFNDIVWWLPFGLFLLEGTRGGARLRAAAPFLCGALNTVAALAVPLFMYPGMETNPDRAARVEYIASHPLLWRGGWSVWVVAALSLLGFYAWWAARVRSRALGMAAMVLAIAGIGGDLLAESLYIGWLPADYDRIAPAARLLTGAWGNTLYTIAGILLTLGSEWLRGPVRYCAWLIWIIGLALGGFSLAGSVTGMSVSMALLFILFCPWTVWVGIIDRRRAS